MSAIADVLVLGAGPAGATIATIAARAGAHVVVLERSRFPRRKVCGEFLSPEGVAVLRRLGTLDRLAPHGLPGIDRFRMTDTHGRSIESPLPDLGAAGRQALGISRALLDQTLAQDAADAGADVRFHVTALAPVVEDGRVGGVRYRLAGSGDDETVRARVVVAADGRRSCLVRALHPELGDPDRAGPGSWYGLECHLAGPFPALAGMVELHLFDGGYLGLSHVEGGRINLALVVTKAMLALNDRDPDVLLRRALAGNPAVARVLDGRARVDGPWKSVGPLRFGPRKPAAAGALFVGDAAGTIDPFCGEGMTHALAAGERAAPFALRAAQSGALLDADARAYTRVWIESFGAVTRRNRRLGRILESPRAARIGMAFLSRSPSWIVPWIVRSTRTGARAARVPA